MLLYTYSGKKSLKDETYDKTYNYLYNYFRINAYINDENIREQVKRIDPNKHFIYDELEIILVKQVYRSYTTLNRFNSILTKTYEVNDDFIKEISIVSEYLLNNLEIKDSYDSQCRKIYDKLDNWYHRLTNNPNSLDTIKWEVARFMKYYEKKGIFKIASINLKRNYYDYVV